MASLAQFQRNQIWTCPMCGRSWRCSHTVRLVNDYLAFDWTEILQ